MKFPIHGGKDSVCLDAIVINDTSRITEILKGENRSILFIFTGLAEDKSILKEKYLENSSILSALQKYKIVKLYVDDKKKHFLTDSLTVGQTNMLFQQNMFNIVSQPYYAIVSNGKMKCSSGYINRDMEVINFLVECK